MLHLLRYLFFSILVVFPLPPSPVLTPHTTPNTSHKTKHQTNTQYHPERLLPALEGLPRPFLRERALLLSRLGRHEAVLRLYVESLGDAALAEAYCEEVCSCVFCVFVCVCVVYRAACGFGRRRCVPVYLLYSLGSLRLSPTFVSQQIWQRNQQQQQQQQPQQLPRQGGEEDADVYLALLRVLLQQEQEQAQDQGGATSQPPPRYVYMSYVGLDLIDRTRPNFKQPPEFSPNTPRHGITSRNHPKSPIPQIINKTKNSWLSFLERNAPRLDAVQVLGILPDRTVPLQLLAPFLTKARVVIRVVLLWCGDCGCTFVGG